MFKTGRRRNGRFHFFSWNFALKHDPGPCFLSVFHELSGSNAGVHQGAEVKTGEKLRKESHFSN